jgi:prevent-host-death family protein
METVGIRDLKAHLSRHLRRVQSGARLLVTARGRSVATISPVDQPADLDWAHRFVAEGGAHWSGGKPTGNPRAGRMRGTPSVSEAVLEDRR